MTVNLTSPDEWTSEGCHPPGLRGIRVISECESSDGTCCILSALVICRRWLGRMCTVFVMTEELGP